MGNCSNYGPDRTNQGMNRNYSQRNGRPCDNDYLPEERQSYAQPERCGQNMPDRRSRRPQGGCGQNRPMPDKCFDNDKDFPIGMAYVPWQMWRDIYKPQKALEEGTVFAELDKPFLGMRGGKR